MTSKFRSSRGTAITAALAALAALLLLGAFGGTALGAAPQNTTLPTISPTTPTTGEAATATTGTWSSEAPVHWFEGESTQLKEGEKVSATSLGGSIAYAATVGGLSGSISCEVTATGISLENPSGGGAGVGNAEITYNFCETTGLWKKCTGAFGAGAVPVKWALSTTEKGKPKIAISPVGANLGTFSLTGAECAAALKGNYPVFGVINGFYSNPGWRIEYNAETSGGKALRLKNAITGPVATATGDISLRTSKGTNFTANALTYSYAWNRCETTCSAISGATGASYTPVAADLGRTLTVTVTATDANGSTPATSAKTGAVKGENFNWYACGEWGEPGVYEDANCSETGASNPFSWSHVTSAPFTSVNSFENEEIAPFTMGWNWSGLQMEIYCSTGNGEGTLSNTESQAKLESYELTLSGCYTLKPSGCELEGSTLAFSLKGNSETTTGSVKPKLKFESSSGPGSALVSFDLEGCAVSGSYELRGWFPALFNNEDSSGRGGSYAETSYLEGVESKGLGVYKGGLFIAYAGMDSGNRILSEGEKPVKLDVAP